MCVSEAEKDSFDRFEQNSMRRRKELEFQHGTSIKVQLRYVDVAQFIG